MVGIPVVLNILIILICIIVSLFEHRRLLAKDPNLDLETIHKKAPYLFVLLVIILFLFAANLILKYRQSIVWNLPLWLQFYYCTLTWGGILAIFSFIFSLASIVAFPTHHLGNMSIANSTKKLLGQCDDCCLEPGKIEVLKMLDLQTKSTIN